MIVGLIGGVHRLFFGGFTAVPCAISTVPAGLISGGIYLLNKKKLIGIMQGILLAIFIESFHGGLTLLISRPYSLALEVFKTVVPAMMVANGLGVAISIIIIHNNLRNFEESSIEKK